MFHQMTFKLFNPNDINLFYLEKNAQKMVSGSGPQGAPKMLKKRSWESCLFDDRKMFQKAVVAGKTLKELSALKDCRRRTIVSSFFFFAWGGIHFLYFLLTLLQAFRSFSFR